jgi:hypothetical protein
VVAKKRGIAKKPQDQAAADWVAAGGIDPEVATLPVSDPVDETVVKSKSSDFTRSTIYLSKALHKRLKIAAAASDLEMSDIAESAISAWLDLNA